MAKVPTNIGRYQIVKSIGHGGMGSLYLAWDKDLERQIVIKVLRDDDEELRARFSREAKSAARLKHAHIVTIFELGDHESQPYIAMEYIEGPTLEEVIRAEEQPPLSRKLTLMAQLCEGLGYAHKAGVVHRDIKPANLMIHKDGDLKILDFGVARIAESASLTQAGMMIGTLNYMSPEQVSGEALDRRSDIFAVGTVFYELLALKKAFPGTISSGVLGKILNAVPEPLTVACPGLTGDVIRIVNRAIEKNVDNRYQDLESMRADLLAVLRRLEEESDETRIIETSPRSRNPTSVSGADRRSTARDDLDRRRASQVQYYLDLAERAMAESRYDSVIAACEQALLLDAENDRALELVEHARSAAEERQAEQLLGEAERELDRGALTVASDLVEQAGALHPSPQQVRLREAIHAAIEERDQRRRRAETIKAAVESARGALDAGAFAEAVRFADQALATDPSHTEAAALRVKATESLARAAREAAERRAREAILEARQRFAKGDHSGAIDMLERYSPSHDAVSRTLTELTAESARIVAERKREAEARAKQQRIAGVLALSREELRDHRFASALERLETLERIEGTTPEIAELIRQVRDAEAAERKAQEEAAQAAAERRREAAARARQQRIADVLALARREMRDRHFASALERLSSLARVEGQAPEIEQVVQQVQAAEAADRKAKDEADRAAEARARDDEARAKKQRIAEEVSRARADLHRQRFASALERLVAVIRTEGATPEITQLVQEIEQAEAFHRKAEQQEAARVKEEALAAVRERQRAEAEAREREQTPTVVIPQRPSPPDPEPADGLPTELRAPRQPEPSPDAGARPGGQKVPDRRTRTVAIAAGVVLVAAASGYYLSVPGSGPPKVTETTTSAVTTTVPTTTTAPPTTVNPDPDPKANLARATSLANTGQTLLAQGRLGQAEARFREAQAVTETKVATAGLQEVARRRREYQRLWQTGERNVRDKDYAAARTSYSAAKDLDSESFVTDGGAGRLSEIEKQITAAETVKTKMAEEAKLAEAARGESRRLVNAGRELAKQGRYDDAEASYADALKHDKDNADAARALNNSLQYRQAKATGESNAQSNDPQTLRDRAQALENARKIDGARFASDSLGKILDDINRRLAPPAVTPGPPKPVDEKPAIQARLEAFARAISTDGNPGKDNGVARTIWPTASPYFNRETQYQHFEFTNLEFLATPAGSGRQVVLCTQIQRYGPDATRLRTPISERVEIVFEKKSGTWFIVTLRTLK